MKKPPGFILLLAIFFSAVYAVVVSQYLEMAPFIVLTSVLISITMGILALLFLKKCLYWYTTFMMSGKKTFNQKVDRPRVYLFSILFPILFIVYYNIKHVPSVLFEENPIISIQVLSSLYFSILLSLIATIATVLFFTLSEKFEILYLQKMEKVVDFLILDNKRKLNPDRAGLIFDRLVKKGFLSYDDRDEQSRKREEFIDVFVMGNITESPSFTLAMDNIQTYHFYKKMKRESPAFKLKDGPEIFENKNGRPSFKSISTSANKATNDPKDHDLIVAVFT